MTAWAAQPMFAGQLDCLESIFANASTVLQRIAVWGDSRTDPQVNVSDRLFEQRMNYKAFRRFGAASETPIARIMLSSRSTSLDPQFCTPVAIAYGASYGPFGGEATNGLSAIANLPPGFGYHQMDATGDFHIAFTLDPRNTSLYATGAIGPFPWEDTDVFFLNSAGATLKPEIFLRKNSSAAATKLQWISAPTDTPTPSFYSTINATAVVGSIGFNSGTGVLKWTGPTINNVSGKYDNFAFRGLNDAEDTVMAGMQVCGARWINSNRSAGMVIQSFGQGTYDADEVLLNHPDMGPTVETFGPYAAHVIILGANDVEASYATPITNYKVKIRALITALKSVAFGGNASTPIVLMNAYNRTDNDFSSLLDAFTQSLIDLCDEFANVAFFNIARAFQESGFDPDDITQSDTIHINTIRTEAHYADMVFGGLEELGGQSSSASTLSSASVASIITAIKADSALGTTGLLRHAAKASIPSGQGTSFPIQGRANIAVYGDSIAAGQVATTEANRWANIVATAQGMNLLNYAIGGRGVWAAASSAQSVTALDKAALIWCAGLNDIRRGTNQAKTRRKIEACIYSMLLSAFSDSIVNADSLTKTGTWTTYGAASVGGRSASGSYADTAGPILSWTFTGTQFGIGFITNSGAVETFGSAIVRVDGEEVDRIYLNNWMDSISDSVNDNRRGPLGRLYCGYGNTEHLVEIEAAGDQIVPVDYVCPLKPPHLCVPVLLADIPYLNAAGYAEDPSYATDELIDIVNQLQREIAAKVSALGFPVGIAETNKYYDLNTGLSVDNIHPNDTGHAQIARGILESIKFSEGSELPNLTSGLRQEIKKVSEIVKIAEADQIFVSTGSYYELAVYERGTDIEILPRKRIKQLGGTDMTSPTTQPLGGFQEP